MTYETQVNGALRTPLNIVKLELDNGLDGNDTLMHCDGNVPLGVTLFPTIDKVQLTPVRATPLKGLGYRGKVVVRFRDIPYGENGTYFGKLIGSNPYYLDRKLKIYTGYHTEGETFDLNNFKERLYFIKEIDGPSDKGVVTITAVDILSKLDSDQAIVPDEYNVSMTADNANHVADSYLETDFGGSFNASPSQSEYFYVRVNDEILYVQSSTTDDNLRIVNNDERFGTEHEESKIGDAVVRCYVVENNNVVDVIRDLIDRYTDIDVLTYIDTAAWEAEKQYLPDLVDVVISESTPVKEVLEQLTSQVYALLWWDDEEQLIKIKSIGQSYQKTRTLDYRFDILQAGHRIRTSQLKAINEVWVYYNRRDWTGSEKDPKNYDDLFIKIDAEAQQALSVRKVKKIFAYSVKSQSAAINLCNKYIAQNKEGYRTIYFRLDPSRANIQIGDIVNITSDLDQGSDGIYITRSYLITEKSDKGDIVDFQASATGFIATENSPFRFIAPDNSDNYDIVDSEYSDFYGYICEDDDEFTNGDPGHLIGD